MSLLRQLSQNRFLRFAAVGGLCLVLIQLPVMGMLERMGMPALLANAGGFIVSTIANFAIQRRVTFGGSCDDGWRSGLWKFGCTSLFSLVVNSAVFEVLHSVMGWFYTASFFAALFGSGVNFALSRIWTFKNRTNEEVTVTTAVMEAAVNTTGEIEQMPNLSAVREVMCDRRLAFFMPAYREEGNLERVVCGLYRYLSSLGLFDFIIFIVEDGSPDQTREIAEGLASRFREVRVIKHEHNMGYGAALISGFTTVARSGADLWAFFDSDGQFAPESLGTLLMEQARTGADMVVGRRIGRRQADSRLRYWLGRSWHLLGEIVIGRKLLTVTDVDCGFKMGSVKALSAFADKLTGQAASISPELIARTNMCGQMIAEVAVTHLSREAGVSTGGKPLVMIRSAMHLLRLGVKLRMERMSRSFKSQTQGGVHVVDHADFAPARAGK